jgi:GNAT superfamily N-acetyltransferase
MDVHFFDTSINNVRGIIVIRIKRTQDIVTVFRLHWELFPGDLWEYNGETACWLMYEDDEPIGFATADLLPEGDTVFLSRAGILPGSQGRGLQKRLIRVREKWAKAQGAGWVITYTTLQNYPTLVNLIRTGYKFYTPVDAWVGPDVHYYIKELPSAQPDNDAVQEGSVG